MGDTRRVVLSKGGAITVVYEGNAFDLDQRSRRLICDLADVMNAYEESNPLLSAPVKTETTEDARTKETTTR